MVTPSRILGPDGQPIRTGDLAEPQTARLGSLQREFQGHPSRGLTPSRLASILQAAEQGDVIRQYELFEDMEERDAHIFAEMGKRRRAVSGLAWKIEPPRNATAAEKAAAATLQEMLLAVEDIDGILFDTTDAVGKGFACQEIEWDRSGSEWMPASIEFRPQSWFQLQRGYRQEIRLRTGTGDGEVLQPFGWITHVHKAKSGYLERAALFRVLVWPYLFKNYSVADLAEFLEIYGIPLRVGKYPPGASEKEKLTLLRALMQIGHNAAGIIPDGMVLDFPTIADGDPDAFMAMIDWCERSQSKAILGGTLTSQADGKTSTNALGNVHNEVRKELKDSDAAQLGRTISRDLVYPLAVLNGLVASGDYRRCPRFVLDVAEIKDIGTYATALPALVRLGMRIKRSWVHTELGIPEAEANDQDVLVDAVQPAPVAPAAPGRAAASLHLRTAAAAQPVVPRDREDQLARLLAEEADPIIGEWVDRIRDLVDRAQGLEDVRDGLLQLLPDMDARRFGQVMQHALAIAGAAGMLDALEDSRV
ncbi:DUF935 domain-containing protein [Xanthomonas sp. CFBP 8445]|uniref:DUF935 domain-containing protein n=1 Tax=Xanthomonas sp. CFBP 8445 TaxID=2971236 RepID=UPI0021DF60DA|nr:DUF935 domain-containing protein [Xanthomonas sp. CFBP 8445]UYC12278.1 DUF935 domain-containing protein [Xanthomonas sp. CFBP 8445]